MSIMRIIEACEKERQRQGLTVTALCRHAGVTRNSYFNWVAGRVTPNIVSVSLIMDVLNMGIEVIRRNGEHV